MWFCLNRLANLNTQHNVEHIFCVIMTVMSTAHVIPKDANVENPALDNKQWYSENELNNIRIEAFQAGVKHSNEQFKKKLDLSQEKAKNLLVEIYLRLFKGLRVKPKMIKLRAIYFNSFEAIFIIPAKDYVSTDRYSHISKLTEEILRLHNSKDFNLSIMFMPASKKINEEAMYADGFNLTFGAK